MAAPHPSSNRDCLTLSRRHESVFALPVEKRAYCGLKSYTHNDSYHTPRCTTTMKMGHAKSQIGCSASTASLSIRSDRHHLQTMPTNILSDSLSRFMEDDEDEVDLRPTCWAFAGGYNAKGNDERSKTKTESHSIEFGSSSIGACGVEGRHSTKVLAIDTINGSIQPRISATCGGTTGNLRASSLFKTQARSTASSHSPFCADINTSISTVPGSSQEVCVHKPPPHSLSSFSSLYAQRSACSVEDKEKTNEEDYVEQARKTTAAPQQKCILCQLPLPSHVNLRDHLSMCPQNTASCPHCRKGFQIQALNAHMVECQQHIRSCFVCDAFVPAKTYLTHVSNCKENGNSGGTHVSGGGGPNKAVEGGDCRKLVPIRMYHGTTEEAAQQILSSQMFHVSEKGLLGEGVYVSADIQKALRYGPAVLECAVYPGKTITIAKRFHPLQKNWRRHGYDSAWIPPNSFVSTSKRSECDEASSSASKIILFSEAGQRLPSSMCGEGAVGVESKSSLCNVDGFDSHVANLAGTRNATGGELEENCVGDPRRVVPLRFVRGGLVTK